ncbi:MAG: HEAT repeat domain-containing protein [Streptosporangiaceae bacterium]
MKVTDAYREMMRGQIAPALRALGFTGSAGAFRYRSGGHEGGIGFQKDGRDVRLQRLGFTVNVGFWWAAGRIFHLMPEPAHDTWWKLNGGEPTGPAADSVVAAIRRYALPAIQAGLDDIDHQLDRAVQWTRTFPPVPDLPDREPDGGGADPSAWYVQAAGTSADEFFADFASDIALYRLQAAQCVAEFGLADTRAVPALVDRLEHDPTAWVRKHVASRILTLLKDDPRVEPALRASADSDEDPVVRWAARYAMRVDSAPQLARRDA